MVYRCVGILTVDVVVFFRSPGVFHSQDFLPSTHLQRPLLKMSPTAGEETSRGRNPENGRIRDFGKRHRQPGFQHNDRPRTSSPELFNKDNAGRESLCHLPTCSVANYELRLYTVNACLCTPYAVHGRSVLLCAQYT